MSDQTNKKELNQLEQVLRMACYAASNDPNHTRTLAAQAQIALRGLESIRPDIKEGMKLLAIKRLQDSMDDGNSGFIQVGDR